jgi:hypothetical protein
MSMDLMSVLILENAIATFKKHNKTYFINYLGKYYTNLKWSFKQNASNM